MTTVQTIVTDALRDLNLIAAEESPDAGEADKALRKLNTMALGWEADNIHIGWSTVALTDDFPLEDKHEQGVTALLVEVIAAGRNQALSPGQAAAAAKGMNRLQADYKAIESLQVDAGLQGMPSQRWPSRWGAQ